MGELSGVIAPATTPFDKNGDIDFVSFIKQINWLIKEGVAGVAIGGSTGEGHTLNNEETRDLIAAGNDAASGRVPIIAGVICDSTREAITRGSLLADLNPAALQVTPVHYLFRPDDESMIEHFKAIASQTGQKIIIYNVVPWTYLSPELLLKIMEIVPSVIGVKQSAGDLKLFADLIHSANPENLIFSAVDALMYPSYTLGAHGSIAAILTAAPKASVELWRAVKSANHSEALELHKKLLNLWNALMPDHNLPASVKFAQHLQGVPSGLPRAPMKEVNLKKQKDITHALQQLGVYDI